MDENKKKVNVGASADNAAVAEKSTKKTAAKKPAAKSASAKSETAASAEKKTAAKKPAAKSASVKSETATSAEKKPAAKKSTAKSASAKSETTASAEKKTATKKPAAKKPAAKKPEAVESEVAAVDNEINTQGEFTAYKGPQVAENVETKADGSEEAQKVSEEVRAAELGAEEVKEQTERDIEAEKAKSEADGASVDEKAQADETKDREVKLSVRNLKVSFRTDGGKVQAVRDISFDLYKGETLAIVGESGSGKSVTNRAIMGILAPNAIKDGGEIIYEGRDLLKITEEEFHKIRGDKIAMIFQDPMSSLNPIMRVGKQITEAMLIKGKINQRESRRDFNSMLKRANLCMDAARGDSPEVKAEDKEKCGKFDRFEYKHLELEQSYVRAKEAADDAIGEIGDIMFRIEKNALQNVQRDVLEVVRVAGAAVEPYVVNARAEELVSLLADIKRDVRVTPVQYVKRFFRTLMNRGEAIDGENIDWAAVSQKLGKVKEILEEAAAFTAPNFFAMGYYLTFSENPLPDMPVDELNVFLRKYLDDNFMLDFIALAKQGIVYSNTVGIENKKKAIAVIDSEIELFRNAAIDRKEAFAAAKRIGAAVSEAIDRMEIVKDNVLYTFDSSMKSAIDLYFDGIVRNEKEERRFARQKAEYDKKVASGKEPSWKVADKDLVDIELARNDIINIVLRARGVMQHDIDVNDSVDFDARSVAFIDYLKDKASGVVHKVTRRLAKNRALKLLDEVGIPDPRKRYKQYPFEMSGGQRQRIVIAIALSANPDILICDEPTTALDVTIQSQILELINKVKEERKLSVIFITHDLGVVANMADRVAVMYAGKIVEIGTAEDIYYSPAHPYTWALLSSMPDLDTKEKLEAIPGTPPNMIYPPKGDAFAERNKYAMQIDFEQQPPMFKISNTHYAATWLLHPNAPKVDPPKSITDRIKRMKERAENGKR